MDDRSCRDATCWLHILGPELPHFYAVEVPDLMCQVSLQVESVLGPEVTDIVQRCLSLEPSTRPTMGDISEEMAGYLYPQMLSP